MLSLRAVVTLDKARAPSEVPGSVRMFVDGQRVGSAVAFDATPLGAIKPSDVAELLGKGEHTLELKILGGGWLPSAMAVNHNALVPDSAKQCQVGLETWLARGKVGEGEVTEVNATVVNRSAEAVLTGVAIVGVPGERSRGTTSSRSS